MATPGSWLKVAEEINNQDYVTSLVVFDNGAGDNLYGVTATNKGYDGCRLQMWNDADAWEQKAGALADRDANAPCLAEFDGKLFAGTFDTAPGRGGKLIEWDGVGDWIVRAPKFGAADGIWDLIVFDDGGGDDLYGSTGDLMQATAGQLLRYNNVNAWNEVAPSLNGQRLVNCLCEHGGELFGGTGEDGHIVRWNKVDAWIKVADKLNNQDYILSLIVYDNGSGDKLYGATRASGRLFRWNDVDACEEVAGNFVGVTYVYALLVFDPGTGNKLFGGASGIGKGTLNEWNDTDSWTEVAGFLDENDIRALVEYKGDLFASTGNDGCLYKFVITPSSEYTFSTLVNERVYQQFF